MGDRLATINMGRKLGAVPFLGGGAGPHQAQCGLGRGLPQYQVAPWSRQPFGHNTWARVYDVAINYLQRQQTRTFSDRRNFHMSWGTAEYQCTVTETTDIHSRLSQQHKQQHYSTDDRQTPFTRYNRLSNQLYNRFDNRLNRVNKHPTGCQTGLTTALTTVLNE